jgi:nucleoside 2-deoxyribosyltransferase
VSKLKVETVDLAERLSEYGVTGFVAHEDIEPTKEWEEEIRLALTTCDALAALLRDGFRASTWTDQEVGFAIGRGILVVPIRMGLDPYGFMAR